MDKLPARRDWRASRFDRGYSKEEREERRRMALCGVYQRTDRILLESTDLGVKPIFDDNLGPGWTTGDDIYLNFRHLPGHTDEELVAMWGLNYHELAHVIMTPRIRGKLRELVREADFRIALNLAEDWRIETHFAGLFNSAEKYFTITVKKLILETDQHKGENEWKVFPLLAGRFYIDSVDRYRYRLKAIKRFMKSCRYDEVKKAGTPEQIQALENDKHFALAKLMGKERIDLIQKLADEFVSSVWSTTDVVKNRHMIDLVQQLKVLLPWEELSMDGGSIGLSDPTKTSTGQQLPSNGNATRTFDEDAQASAAEIIARDQEERDRLDEMLKGREDMKVQGKTKPGEDEGEGEGKKGKGKPEDESPDGSPWKGEGDKEAVITIDPRQNVPNGERGDDSQDQSKPEGGRTADGHLSASAGFGSPDAPEQWAAQLTGDQLAELDRIFKDTNGYDALMSDEIRALLESKDVQRDLRNIRRAVAEALGEGLDLGVNGQGKLQTAPANIRIERNRLERELDELRSALDAGWVENQNSGKINLRAWTNASPAQRPSSFRGWIPDAHEEAELEAVILIDRSSSMSSAIDHASQVCWTIASAIQAGGHLTLIGFADPSKEEVLISRNSKVNRDSYTSYGTYGGTNCAEALKMARKVLAASPAPNKLLVVVTDGGWADIEESVKEVKKINADDVETMLVLMGMHMERDRRGCKHVVHANDVAQMGQELKKVVRKIAIDSVRRVNSMRGEAY